MVKGLSKGKSFSNENIFLAFMPNFTCFYYMMAFFLVKFNEKRR